MPQMAPIVLTHDSVDSTFSPRGQDASGVTTFVNGSGVPIADRRITFLRSRTASSGREKLTIKMVLPTVLDATSDEGITSPRVVRTSYVDISFTYDATSTEAERFKVRSWAIDLLGDLGVTAKLNDQLEYLF